MPPKKPTGTKNGAQDQHDGNHRACHFVHGLLGGLLGRQPIFDVTLDILDHDDGVIDHDADGRDDSRSH